VISKGAAYVVIIFSVMGNNVILSKWKIFLKQKAFDWYSFFLGY
jgi:hypothetical protein